MKIENLSLKGITRFVDRVEIPFKDIPGPLVAIVGPNGAGKTTILESFFACLFRELPSRLGSLYESSQGRDAIIEEEFSLNGDTYKATLLIDTVGKKQEGYLLKNGQPLCSGKVSEYDPFVRDLLGTPELFLSTVFSAQNRKGNFLLLGKGERKELFAELLGLQRLQAISATAKEAGKNIDSRLSLLRERIKEKKAEVEKKEGIEKELKKLKEDLEISQKEEDETRKELEALTKEEAGIDLLLKDAEDISKKMASLLEKKSDIEKRIVNNSKLIQDEPKIRESSVESEVLKKEISEIEIDVSKSRKAFGEIIEKERKYSEVNKKLAVLNEAEKGAREDSRILENAPCKGSYPECGFLSKAVNANNLLKDIPKDIDALKNELDAIDYNANKRKSLEDEITLSETSLEQKTVRLKTLEPLFSSLPHLENAISRLEELNGVLKDIEKEENDLRLKDKELGEKSADAVRIKGKTENLRKKGDSLKSGILGLTQKLGALGSSLENISKAETSLAVWLEEERMFVSKRTILSILEKAFGKDGIQALEIDAAGPEVSRITNELLVNCFGSRFALSLETTRLSSDGKKDIEVFDIRVLDSERGRDGDVESLSGGEKVIISEALSLSLAIYNKQRSGLSLQTLFRDETAGALDPENTRRYILMLRKALEIGHFDKVIFIAQQPDVWEMADSKIFIKDGGITVD